MGGHSHTSDSSASAQRQGQDINIGKIVVIGVLSLVVFAVGIVWAYYLLVNRQEDVRQFGPARVPTEIGKSEIGIVDQVLFSVDTRLDRYQAAARKKLGSYGWVDRARGIARIPIEAAMQQVVANPPDIVDLGVSPMAAPASVPQATPSGALERAGANPATPLGPGQPPLPMPLPHAGEAR